MAHLLWGQRQSIRKKMDLKIYKNSLKKYSPQSQVQPVVRMLTLFIDNKLNIAF
jgi:hypothetical protein